MKKMALLWREQKQELLVKNKELEVSNNALDIRKKELQILEDGKRSLDDSINRSNQTTISAPAMNSQENTNIK